MNREANQSLEDTFRVGAAAQTPEYVPYKPKQIPGSNHPQYKIRMSMAGRTLLSKDDIGAPRFRYFANSFRGYSLTGKYIGDSRKDSNNILTKRKKNKIKKHHRRWNLTSRRFADSTWYQYFTIVYPSGLKVFNGSPPILAFKLCSTVPHKVKSKCPVNVNAVTSCQTGIFYSSWLLLLLPSRYITNIMIIVSR